MPEVRVIILIVSSQRHLAHMYLPSNYKKVTQCWLIVGSASVTLKQHCFYGLISPGGGGWQTRDAYPMLG